MHMEILWACICLLKVSVDKPTIYKIAGVGIVLSGIIGYFEMSGLIRSFFLIIAAYFLIVNDREKSKLQPISTYLSCCLVLVTVSTFWALVDEDIKCYYVKYVIMILSLGLVELSETLKVQEFKEYI